MACLDAVKRNRFATFQERIEPAPVLCDFRPRQIDHRIEQRHGFGKDGCDILPALSRHSDPLILEKNRGCAA